MEYILSSERFDELMTITKKSPGVFLNISQNSRKNTCVRVSFLVMPQACNFIKKETLTQLFLVNLVKFLRTTFFMCFIKNVALKNFTKLYSGGCF